MYDFSTAVSRRGTGCIKWDTVPEDVIALSIADADWATAPAVLDAVRDRMNGHPLYGYGFDDGGFRDVVVQWFWRKYGFTLDKSWIVLLRGLYPRWRNCRALFKAMWWRGRRIIRCCCQRLPESASGFGDRP